MAGGKEEATGGQFPTRAGRFGGQNYQRLLDGDALVIIQNRLQLRPACFGLVLEHVQVYGYGTGGVLLDKYLY